MHKVFTSLLVLSAMASFLCANPGSAQQCATFVASCTNAWNKFPPFPCASDPDAGEYVGTACATPGEVTIYGCHDTVSNRFCCGCAPGELALIVKIVIPQEVDHPLRAFVHSGMGLVSVDVHSSENVVIDIPEFEAGIVLPIAITVRKIDPLKPGRFMLRGCDSYGCRVFDPVYTVTVRETGKPMEERFADLPYEENKVSLSNHTPGVKHLEIVANGKRFKVNDLHDGESRTIDIASAMMPGGRNVVALRALGQPGGSVTVVIHD